MDAIGQLNLQLGDVEAQKFQGRSQALGAIRQGVGNVVSDFQKQQVENALAGDFNDIAKSAKEKGVPDTLLTAMAGMWNSAQGRDEKLKIIANLQTVIQAKEEKTKQEKAVEGYRNLPQGYTPADVVKNYVPGTEDAAKIFMSGAMEPVKKKTLSPQEKASSLYGGFSQGKILVAKAGREGQEEIARQELINKNAPEFAKQLQASGDEDFTDYNTALNYARNALEERVPKAPKADKPPIIRINTGDNKIEPDIQKKMIANKQAATELAEIMKDFKTEYAGATPFKSLEQFKLQAESRGVIGNPEANNWWKRLNRFFSKERKDLFGASFTSGEQKIWEAISTNPADAPESISLTLNDVYGKLNEDQRIFTDVTSASGKEGKLKTLQIAPAPVMSGRAPAPAGGAFKVRGPTGKIISMTKQRFDEFESNPTTKGKFKVVQ